MLILEMIMVAIGLGAVIFSYKMVEEKKTGSETNAENVHVSVADTEQFERKVEQLQERAEVVFEEIDEKISTLSNEKIMGVSEYSEQVLDKIEKNHAEVVFLYDMMNKKQEEIQQSISEIDGMKADIRDEAAKEYQKLKEQEVVLQEMRKEIQLESVEMEANRKRIKEEFENLEWKLTGGMESKEEVVQINEETEPMKESVVQEERVASELNDEIYENALEHMDSQMMDADFEEEDEPFASIASEIYDAEIARIEAEEAEEAKKSMQNDMMNRNDEIIALYKKGRSILDISKMLAMGQGEVKFVIDLYQAR